MKGIIKVAGTLFLGAAVALFIDAYLVDLNHHSSAILANALPLLYAPQDSAWLGFAALAAVLYLYSGYQKWLLMAVIDPKGEGCPFHKQRTGRVKLHGAELASLRIICTLFMLFWPVLLAMARTDQLIEEASTDMDTGMGTGLRHG